VLLLQPATTSEPSAAAAMTRRPFIGYASIPVISQCRNHVARVARGLTIYRQIGHLRGLGLDAAPEQAPYALPPAEFIPPIKPLPFTPRQEG